MNKYDRYNGCCLICLKDFVRENIEPFNGSVLLLGKNLGKAYRKIFNSGNRNFITVGSLINELNAFAESLYAEIIEAKAKERMTAHFLERGIK